MIFALCGGDARTLRLSALLCGGGEVRAWALEDAALPPGVRECATAAECCSGAGCIVLPMSAEDGRGFLNAPFSPRPRCAAEALAAAEPGALVCAGAPSRALADICAARGLALADYGARESFRAANSLATAEGALAVLIRETDGVLCGSRAALIGAGRVTRALAPRLAALGVRVAVVSRRPEGRAWARAGGLEAFGHDGLAELLPGCGAVINTAPALVLTAPLLTRLAPDALVLDLASAPGGVDFDAARGFGIRCLTAPGLPGKFSPGFAAGAVRGAIYEILEEYGK